VPIETSKYCTVTPRSTRRHQQETEGNSGLGEETIPALWALRSFRSKMDLVAESERETHFLNNQEKEQCIKDHVVRETTVARKRV
jgi:hypothetical protein